MAERRRIAASAETTAARRLAALKSRRFPRETGVVLLEILGITGGIAWLCYDSFWGMVWLIAVGPLWKRRRDKLCSRQLHIRKQQEFKELLLMISASIQAGYSVENAFADSEKELQKMFGDKSMLVPLLHEMNVRVGMNVPLEKAFLQFAGHLGLEDAISFAEIFSFAKRTGGDYGKNIRRTALKIEEKIGICQEIETILTEKQLELKIMSWMPPGMILYVRLTSGEFMKPLYHNAIGVLVMTGCLCLYALMLLLGERFVNIEV